MLGRQHFTHTRALADWYTASGRKDDYGTWGGSPAKGLSLLQHGDLAAVDKAKTLLESFQESIPSTTRKWTSEVAGGLVNVGAFLAGDPEHMWQLSEDKVDTTPLRVWVGLTSSAGVSTDEIFKRGIALAAFAIALSERRTVYLTPYWLLGAAERRDGYRARINANNAIDDMTTPNGALVSYDLSASPMILSEVAACLAHVDVTRALGISICYAANANCNGTWLDGYENEAKMKRLLGAAPDDIWLGSIHMHDPLLKDPVKWVKEQLAIYLGEDGGE